MGFPEKAVEGFPIGYVLYILISGLVLVLSFPFDIFSIDMSNGLNLLGSTDFLDYILSPDNFIPLSMFRHLNTTEYFLIVLTKILMVSFAIGLLFYIFKGFFYFINHPSKIKAKLFSDQKKRIDPEEDIRGTPEFARWVRQNGHDKHTDFLWSITEIIKALLYSTETLLFFITFPIAFLSIIFTNSTFGNWVGKLTSPVLLFVVSILLYKFYEREYEKEMQPFWDRFRKNQKKLEKVSETREEIENLKDDLATWTDSLEEMPDIESTFLAKGKTIHGKTILDVGTDCVKPLYIALKYEPKKIVGINEEFPMSFASDLEGNSKLFAETKIRFYTCSFFDNETIQKIKEKEEIKRFDFVLLSKTLHHLRSGKCIANQRDPEHKHEEDEKSCIYKFEKEKIFDLLFNLGDRIIIYEAFCPQEDDKIRGRGGNFTD